MLYKKIYRQYLREFRIGRKFKFYGGVFKITEKPRIEGNYIRVDDWDLISITGGGYRQMWFKGDREEITWLD